MPRHPLRRLGKIIRIGAKSDAEKTWHVERLTGQNQNVRRLVEREDYLLRLMRDAGVRAPGPYGIATITPEREYLIVTEFLAGAEELTDAAVDDEIIDDALGLVRRMWDNGLAHRDICCR